ncbi:hypothetical protein ACWEO1_30665 [Kitasatospora cineracea]|uniref:hypothetical protein n=1 Tax=Kitasatospora sp. NRRL B-11411 TaxID=1463822 RepID=UPI000ACEF8BC|nr:hypothetical protein [Kitasatospora sp. NRRL B-11411]
MIKRLAIVGGILLVAGPLNLSGYGTVTTAAGAVALLGAGVAWAVTRRRAGKSGRS